MTFKGGLNGEIVRNCGSISEDGALDDKSVLCVCRLRNARYDRFQITHIGKRIKTRFVCLRK